MSDTPRTDDIWFDTSRKYSGALASSLYDLSRELERENAALRSALDQQANYQRELRADRDRLDWLEQFLQMGRASVFSSPTCEAHKDRPDDTEKTRWNHPFHIGYDVELEHRGCYKWQELSNGAKGIRPAIDAAIEKKSNL
jgi:hypothetical protein